MMTALLCYQQLLSASGNGILLDKDSVSPLKRNETSTRHSKDSEQYFPTVPPLCKPYNNFPYPEEP
jgi:hypothetical protein